MRKSFFRQLYKEYGISGLVFLVLIFFFIGGLGAVFIQRTVLPYLASWPVFRSLQTFQIDSPVVITRREEVRIVEGVNQAEVVSRTKDSLVLVYLHEGEFDSGNFRVENSFSGVVVTSDGLIMVPRSLLRPGLQITALTAGGGAYVAEVVASDTLTGTALLQIEADNLRVAREGFSEDLTSGERLVVVYPEEDLTTPSARQIVLSRPGTMSPSLVRNYSLQELNVLLQADWALADRRLGAAVVNKDAQLVGFVTRTGGENVIVRAEDLRRVINDYLDDQTISRTGLDLTYQFFGETQTELFGLPERSGVLLKQAQAPLQIDDFIYAVNGTELTARESLQELLLDREPGTVVGLRLIRDGIEREVELQL